MAQAETGTVFDIINTNETTSPSEQTTKPNQEEQPSTATYKPSKKLNQLSDKKTKNVTEENAKVKAMTKKEIYKNADPKKSNSLKSLTKQDGGLNKEIIITPIINKDGKEMLNITFRKNVDGLSKEVPIYPIVNDPSRRLNRTFRKEVPSDEYPEIGDINNLKEITNNRLPENDTDQVSDILPSKSTQIDVSNSNQSEAVRKLTTAIEEEALKKQFLPKSLQNDEENTTAKYESTVKEEVGEQPRPNRQRQLTRTQRKSFYPYFFSRVLG